MPGFNVYFATDLHGSEQCFRKFLNAGKFYGADAVILGGDVAGKALIPVVSGPQDSFEASAYGRSIRAEGEDGLAGIEDWIRALGCYPYRTTPDELQEMRDDPDRLNRAFEQVISETLERWISMAEDRLRALGLPCLVMPGNDDPPWVRRLLDQAGWLQQAEERIVGFGPYQVLSLGYSTPTPWDSPREITEDQMRAKLTTLAEHLDPAQPTIFNLHNPPFGTAGGEPVQVPVGSHAIRESIEDVQPVVALCGHIHESRATSKLGRTLVVNPGSQYPEGILQGSILTLDRAKVTSHRFVAG